MLARSACIGLSPAFAALDKLLADAVEQQAKRLGTASLLDPWRGLHLGVEDARRSLAEAPLLLRGNEPGPASLVGELARSAPAVARMSDLLGLSDEDLAIVLLALAPDVDLRYERLFGYLQDDITRKRPGPDLVVNLFCRDVDARLDWLARLAANAPLAYHGVLDVEGLTGAPCGASPLVLDVQWRNFLAGIDELDPRLARVGRLATPARTSVDAAPVDAGVRELAWAAVRTSVTEGKALRLLLVGPQGAGKTALADCIAGELGLRRLTVDVRDCASPQDVRALVSRATRASVLLDALLHLRGAGHLVLRDPQLARALNDSLATSRAWFILSLSASLPELHALPLRARRIVVGLPSSTTRLAIWKAAIDAEGLDVEAADLAQVATRFRLGAAQIGQAAASAAVELSLARSRRATASELGAASRVLCGEELSKLAHRIEPQATFESLVTSIDADAQLREICTRVAIRDVVRDQWTCGSLHARNAGVTALFAGPSGTGKTLAAEVVARELGYDLFRIDLASIVSKYIGETEKNLDRVFAAAENANAVLFFDEAEALFGKRSEVKDAHDRYANIEIAYLLQKMEQFDGLAILATNLRQNLDEAFARRLTFCVNFAFPEVGERARLWQSLWPAHAPRADDVDLDWFAREFALSGGNIRNAILAAIHLAAAGGSIVTREHVMHATRREYQKLGKNIVDPACTAARKAA